MAAASNGRAKKPKKATPNGHANGHLNGYADKTKSTSLVGRPQGRSRQSRTMIGSLASVAGRLVSWYIIITVLFRCPTSLTHISETSPPICKPYLQARSYAAPYLDPYYHAYVAPQLEKIQPYVSRFDDQVYTPVASFTKDKYATYGAHRVEQAQKQAEAQWAKTVRPQLQNAQASVSRQYDQYLAPHVKTASDAVGPFYYQIKDSVEEIYHLSILPAYEAALPYAREGYVHGHHLVAHIIFPNVRIAKDATWKFISRTLWPQVRILYGDNVEPQLVRIRERLGRYKDQQKIESVVDAVEPEPTIPSISSEDTASIAGSSASPHIAGSSTASSPIASSSTASKKSGGWGVLDDFFGGESSTTTEAEVETQVPQKPPVPEQPKLSPAELKEKLNEDLRNWQSKFATAADKGAEDLEVRVADITKRQIENGVQGHGAALVTQLEETTESAIANFKDFIKKSVQDVPENATEEDLEAAYEKSVAKTRELGLAVKEKAQAIRSWKASYDQELDSLVRAAVQSTVDVLDRIYGLGLQEVGMRWAWTDGVTYKDWQNYHKLKHTLTAWQTEVENVGAQHEGLRLAHEEASKIEDKAMSIASSMVNELVRLKDVSRWKIWAEDSTDDFSDKKVPPRTFKAAQEAVKDAQDLSSEASEAILGSETPTTESVASAIKESVSDASSKISESVVGSGVPSSESLASEAKSKASELSSKVSETAIAAESSVESATEQAKETLKEAASAASAAPKKVMGGAMAQVIAEAKQVVFDDVIDDDDSETYSEKLQDAFAEAGDRASDLSRAVSEALLGTKTSQGAVESATSLASEQYEKALAAASSVLYGTEKQPLESATSVASEKFAQAVTAASYAVYGTPTSFAIIHTVQAQASSRYSEAVSLANEQYSNAKSQLSVLVSGTPQPAHETLLSVIEKAYSDSVAGASERMQAALQYTDSVKSYAAGPTQGYFESVSSIASSRLSEGLSIASAQFTSQPTPTLDAARRQYYEVVGLAHERYYSFLGAASSAFYGPEQGTFESLASVASATAASIASGVSDSAGSAAANAQEVVESLASEASSSVIGTETPWTESVASKASQNWEDLIAKASSQVYGAPTPWADQVYSQAGSYAAQATSQASEQFVAVQALISELVIGKEPDFTESVMNRLASAYYTGIPAAISSVNSAASENFEAATDYVADAYASASSVVSSIFTPPPAIETILSQANEQLNAAVESASIAVYGTSKGSVEQASESIASAYSSVQSKASEAIYGTQQAQNSFLAVASSAQAAISEAVFGTPTVTGYAASATSAADSVYSSMSSAASQKAADAASAISSAIYGPEQGAVESASSRLAAAVDAANSRIVEIYASASKNAEEVVGKASDAASAATQRVKDEL